MCFSYIIWSCFIYLNSQLIIILHLACISNDPSFDLNPTLGKSINLDAFAPLVEISKKHLIKKFIFASSSSVYGVKEEKDVTIEQMYTDGLLTRDECIKAKSWQKVGRKLAESWQKVGRK